MSENQIEDVNKVYSYVNDKGQTVYTPNFDFANIMASKYGTLNVYVEKN